MNKECLKKAQTDIVEFHTIEWAQHFERMQRLMAGIKQIHHKRKVLGKPTENRTIVTAAY